MILRLAGNSVLLPLYLPVGITGYIVATPLPLEIVLKICLFKETKIYAIRKYEYTLNKEGSKIKAAIKKDQGEMPCIEKQVNSDKTL